MSDANARLNAFCDGVFAIALTLLIVDIKVPPPEGSASTAELWRALGREAPAVFAFLLSFAIVLVTWVSHHGILKLVRESSACFIYANGLLLLTVVATPFSASLLGAFVATATMQARLRRAYFAFILYGALALTAVWFPMGVAIATTATWLFWLTLSIRIERPA